MQAKRILPQKMTTEKIALYELTMATPTAAGVYSPGQRVEVSQADWYTRFVGNEARLLVGCDGKARMVTAYQRGLKWYMVA